MTTALSSEWVVFLPKSPENFPDGRRLRRNAFRFRQGQRRSVGHDQNGIIPCDADYVASPVVPRGARSGPDKGFSVPDRRNFATGDGNRRPVGQGGGNGHDPFRQPFRLGQQGIQRIRLVQAERVTVLPNQFREHGSAPESHPQAVGQGAYVGAGTASDSEGGIRKINPEHFRMRDSLYRGCP